MLRRPSHFQQAYESAYTVRLRSAHDVSLQNAYIHLDHLRLEKRVLDIPCGGQECQRPHHEFDLAGELEALWRSTEPLLA